MYNWKISPGDAIKLDKAWTYTRWNLSKLSKLYLQDTMIGYKSLISNFDMARKSEGEDKLRRLGLRKQLHVKTWHNGEVE